MIGIDLPDHDTAEALEQACFRRGLLVLTCGRRTIRLAPPLVVTTGQADTALAILADALETLGDGLPASTPTLLATGELDDAVAALERGVGERAPATLGARTPITGGSLGAAGGAGDVERAVAVASDAFATWRTTPAPRARQPRAAPRRAAARAQGRPRPSWCRSRPARSAPRASARCRR